MPRMFDQLLSDFKFKVGWWLQIVNFGVRRTRSLEIELLLGMGGAGYGHTSTVWQPQDRARHFLAPDRAMKIPSWKR